LITVIVVSAFALVALSVALAIALSRAAAHGDECIGEDLALLRARASVGAAPPGAPPPA
jgi:hypothetical protein